MKPDIPLEFPVGLMVGIMVLGVVLVLIACLPTAWVDRVHREIRKRREGK